MGVTGLWDIIAPAGKSRSLAHIAVVNGFEKNTSQTRAYRIGIDASLWFKHAYWSKEGENPQIRMLFFRIVQIAKLPLLPLFVLDGRSRPKVKRGSKMGKSGSHALAKDLKMLLDAFGMEWREAAGEAEAELAYLNRIGAIDAVMTDDADTFLFGANTLIRNASLSLTGNKALPAVDMDGKASKSHVMVFTDEELRKNPQVGLSQGGMILFALLTGGDYDSGVDRVGKQTAHALARCGFGDELFEAIKRRETHSLHNFLPAWRQRINTELRENRKGFLQRCRPGLFIPDSFPVIELLDKYVEPVLRTGGANIRGNGEMNLPLIAALCEKYFEWGTRTTIIKRFRSFLWEACVIRVLRRVALDQDKKEVDARLSFDITDTNITGVVRPDISDAVGTSVSLVMKYLNSTALDRRSEAFVNRENPASTNDSKSFILGICSDRRHTSTDRLLEYRLEVDPSALVRLTNTGIKGTRPDNASRSTIDDDNGDVDSDEDPSSPKRRRPKKAGSPTDPFRIWCPASMLERIDPRILNDFEQAKSEKTVKKDRGKSGTTPMPKGKGKGKGKRKAATSGSDTAASMSDTSPSSSPFKKKRAVAGQSSQPSLSRHSAMRHLTLSTTVPLGPEEKLSAVSSLQGSENSQLQSSQSTAERLMVQSVHCTSSADTSSNAGQRFNFLFHINDPCDPDLIEREDLRTACFFRDEADRIFENWVGSSSDLNQYGYEDYETCYSDDSLDRLQRQEFMQKARSSAFVTKADYKGRKSMDETNSSVVPVQKSELPRRSTVVESAERSMTAPRRAPLRRRSRLSEANVDEQLSHSIPSSSQTEIEVPLFLPLVSPEKSNSTRPIVANPPEGVIDLDSSDEDLYPNSSENSTSNGWSRTVSYASSQSSLQTKLSGTTLGPSSSQTSSFELGDFSFSW